MRRTKVSVMMTAAIALGAGVHAPRAADNVTFLQPAAGSVFHVGDTLHVKLAFIGADTSWATQLFDFHIDEGLMRGDMGVTAGGHYADSMRQYIAEHREFDWVIPESLSGTGRVMFSTANAGCMIGTRPYPFSSNPVGAYGTSAVFSVEPASGNRSVGRQRGQSADFRIVGLPGSRMHARIASEGLARIAVLSPDGRMLGYLDAGRAISREPPPLGAGLRLLRAGNETVAAPAW